MLRLFQSLFGESTATAPYSDSLVRKAIERAVDGTDPWLRGVTGYRKMLRPAVLAAIDHVVTLVDDLPPPCEASRAGYAHSPLLRAYFISFEQMQATFRNDKTLNDFLAQTTDRPQQICALLVMERHERRIFGAELRGETIQYDVPQTTVSFAEHRLIDPAAEESQTRFMLKRRAFDHLLALALERIAAMRDTRDDLIRHRTLLQAKLDLLHRGQWGFDPTACAEAPNCRALEVELAGIETRLSDVGGDDRTLETHLGVVRDVLGSPERSLWAQTSRLIVDSMGIKRLQSSPDTPELTLTELHNSAGRRLVASLVNLTAATG